MYPGTFSQSTPEKTAILLEDTGESLSYAGLEERLTNGITLVSPREWRERPGTVGRAKLGVIHVGDDDGAEVGTGTVGTIHFERPQRPLRYHNDEKKSATGKLVKGELRPTYLEAARVSS